MIFEALPLTYHMLGTASLFLLELLAGVSFLGLSPVHVLGLISCWTIISVSLRVFSRIRLIR